MPQDQRRLVLAISQFVSAPAGEAISSPLSPATSFMSLFLGSLGVAPGPAAQSGVSLEASAGTAKDNSEDNSESSGVPCCDRSSLTVSPGRLSAKPSSSRKKSEAENSDALTIPAAAFVSAVPPDANAVQTTSLTSSELQVTSDHAVPLSADISPSIAEGTRTANELTSKLMPQSNSATAGFRTGESAPATVSKDGVSSTPTTLELKRDSPFPRDVSGPAQHLADKAPAPIEAPCSTASPQHSLAANKRLSESCLTAELATASSRRQAPPNAADLSRATVQQSAPVVGGPNDTPAHDFISVKYFRASCSQDPSTVQTPFPKAADRPHRTWDGAEDSASAAPRASIPLASQPVRTSTDVTKAAGGEKASPGDPSDAAEVLPFMTVVNLARSLFPDPAKPLQKNAPEVASSGAVSSWVAKTPPPGDFLAHGEIATPTPVPQGEASTERAGAEKPTASSGRDGADASAVTQIDQKPSSPESHHSSQDTNHATSSNSPPPARQDNAGKPISEMPMKPANAGSDAAPSSGSPQLQHVIVQSATASPNSVPVPRSAAPDTSAPIINSGSSTTSAPGPELDGADAPSKNMAAEPGRHLDCAPIQSVRFIHAVTQSEMQIGLRMESFGAVQVRTTVSDRQVELALVSERGDLKGLMVSELPALQTALQQHDLRLQQFRGLGPGYTAQADVFSGGAGPRQEPRRDDVKNHDVKNGDVESNVESNDMNNVVVSADSLGGEVEPQRGASATAAGFSIRI